MTRSIFAVFGCYNRHDVLHTCVEQFYEHKGPRTHLKITDDGSTDLDVDRLRAHCDELVRATRDDLRPMHRVNDQKVGQLLEFVFDRSEDLLYMTESDAFHDPNWRRAALEILDELDLPVCLFRSRYHETNRKRQYIKTLDVHPLCFVRDYFPGISFLATREQCIKALSGFLFGWRPNISFDQLLNSKSDIKADIWSSVRTKAGGKRGRSWDYLFARHFGNRIAVSRTSYVEHCGIGGLNTNDTAANPTKFLKKSHAYLTQQTGATFK